MIKPKNPVKMQRIKFFRLIDFTCLGIKSIPFTYILIKSMSSQGQVQIYFINLLWPFLVYFIVVLIRLIRPYLIIVIYLELLLNIIFIVLFGINHLVFFSFTLISMFCMNKILLIKRSIAEE